MSSTADAIETKLAAARTKLILDKPFLGALVLRLPMKAANSNWCPTTATDAKNFYYNPEYIDGLSLEQTQFMLSHEALHCALRHFARRGHRIKRNWDLACDFAINPLLIDDGLTPPPDSLWLDDYRGMTAEEIYPLLEETENMETLDQHLYDSDSDGGGPGDGDSTPPPKPQQQPKEGGDDQQQQDEPSQGDGTPEKQSEDGTWEADNPLPDKKDEAAQPPPSPLSQEERETLGVQWQQRMAGAAQQAMQAGKFGGSLARMIDHLLQPQLPWRNLLARYMSMLARDDFSYMRPSRREGDAIYPSLRSAQIDIVVAIDTSGSIKSTEISEFIAEIDALKGQLRARITLLPCDANIVKGAPWIYEAWEAFEIPEKMYGGGGTDFRPVFKWIEKQGMQPQLLIYFTDAEGKFPKQIPDFPTIWLVKGKKTVPWGERIQLN